MSPLKHSNNIAARMGRWSASHWKTAVFAWLVFVVAAFATSIFFPMKVIEQKDAGVGESAMANKILDKSFDLDQTGQFELVVVQSKTKTVDDPAFRATLHDLTGGWTVPQSLIDERPIGGYTELWRLDREGRLEDILAA